MSTEFFTAKGKIQYVLSSSDPTAQDKNHNRAGASVKNLRQGAKKRSGKPWVLVEVPNGIAQYYRAQVIRNLINPFRQEQVPNKPVLTRMHPPMWGAHITVLDGRHDVPEHRMHLWEQYQDDIVEFEYSHVVEQHWKFFVLPVRCAKLDLIRQELGLPPKKLHITVGRIE